MYVIKSMIVVNLKHMHCRTLIGEFPLTTPAATQPDNLTI